MRRTTKRDMLLALATATLPALAAAQSPWPDGPVRILTPSPPGGSVDAVARVQPGVLNDEGSHQMDSFNPALDGLLDCPHYTRPEAWRGQSVPPILMSGNHALIERWRRDQRLQLTQRQRPELVRAARRAGHLSKSDEAFLADLPKNPGLDA